jgi:hypothetical protein
MTTTADDDGADGPVSVSSGGDWFSDRYTWRRRAVAFQVVLVATCAALGQTFSEDSTGLNLFGNSYNAVYTWGGVLTVVSCLSVIVTYLKFQQWRVHPNPLVFWRSVADLCFGSLVIFYSRWKEECTTYWVDYLVGWSTSCPQTLLAVALAFCLAAESWYRVPM